MLTLALTAISLASVLPLPDGAVRFPDTPSYNKRVISPCPRDEEFCESIPDYPFSERVDHDLTENTLIKEKIFDSQDSRFTEIQTRSFVSESSRACQAVRSRIFPKKAVNTRGEYVFIVNHDQYRQSVEIEQCQDDESECRTDEDAPFSRSTVCRQKYTTHKLYAMTEHLEQIYDSFSLPSACICYYKTQFRSSPNIGLRSSFKAPLPSGSSLPFCEAGAKLDLPRFVSQFSSSPRQSRAEGDNVVRTSTAGRPFVHSDREYQRWSRDFVFPDNFHSGVERYSRWQRDTRMRRRRRNRRRNSTRPSSRSSWSSPSSGCGNTGKSYCEETGTTNYPEELTRNLLAKSPAVGGAVFKQVFDDKCTNSITIGTRFFSVEDEQLCRGRQKVIFPRTALNLNNEWRFVVNIDNFTQAVEIEGE